MIESLTGQGINVRQACRVLGVSESGYYDWKDRPDPPRTLRRIWLAGEIVDVHKASGGTYGYMRVAAELRHGREIVVGHNTVGKIMSELGGSRGCRRAGCRREHGSPRSPTWTSSAASSAARAPTSSG